jgi:hypothetical protein
MKFVKNHIKVAFVAITMLLLSSCSNSSGSNNSNTFLKKEVEKYIHLNDQKDVLQFINRQSEVDTIRIKAGNLKKYLQLFSFYSVDSSIISRYTIVINSAGAVEGRANEKQLPLQSFSFLKKEENLEHLILKVKDVNQLYNMNYELELTQEGYLIKAIQNVDWAFQDSFRIEGIFVQ